MKITMKIPYLIVAITMFFTSLCFATENIALSASDQAQIEAQAKEMSTVGVPAEPARNMLTAMHQHQFTSQNIVRAQQEVMNCAKAGLPTEPVMNKASEGMAKKASEQQVIAAMQTVHSRYARANRMAKIIVDQFEVVEVDHDAGKLAFVPERGVEQQLETVRKSAPVQTAGEPVAGRQIG